MPKCNFGGIFCLFSNLLACLVGFLSLPLENSYHYYFRYFFCYFLILPVCPLTVSHSFCNCPTVLVYSVHLFTLLSLHFSLGSFYQHVLKFSDFFQWATDRTLVSSSKVVFISITVFFDF